MEAIPKSDIKSDIRFGNRFDIRLKQTTWIGHEFKKELSFYVLQATFFSLKTHKNKHVY